MFGKKKEAENPEEEVKKPAPVMAGSDEGANVKIGDQNDPNRIVIMKQSYAGTPDKSFRFSVDESLTSIVYDEEKGYLDEYVTGSVQPSKYWEKGFLRLKPREISVLSFSDMPFTIATGITFRVPGGDLNGTVRGSFKFSKGTPRAIASILQSSYAQDSAVYDVHRRSVTAEALEKILRTAFQDVIRTPLFRETIYQDLDDLQDAIKDKVNDTPFFMERSLSVSEISVRPERTDVEKLEDSEVKHKIEKRLNEMEIERRKDAIELAKTESETFKDL